MTAIATAPVPGAVHGVREMTYVEAGRAGLDEEMARDSSIFVVGQGIGALIDLGGDIDVGLLDISDAFESFTSSASDLFDSADGSLRRADQVLRLRTRGEARAGRDAGAGGAVDGHVVVHLAEEFDALRAERDRAREDRDELETRLDATRARVEELEATRTDDRKVAEQGLTALKTKEIGRAHV